MHPPRADTPALAPITLVGPGRVGTALTGAATIAGLEVTLVGRADLAVACADAEVVLLCVPDAEIAAAAAAVAKAAPGLRMIGHTSGATELVALAAATSAGAEAFSLHPLQTIPAGDAQLVGAPAAIEGEPRRADAGARPRRGPRDEALRDPGRLPRRLPRGRVDGLQLPHRARVERRGAA
ncbi:MAG: hypothetical protein R2700_12445 [Solirubrobacterales bacterium]